MTALLYHEFPFPGKTEIMPTKNCRTREDLSSAYSPGVAEPCIEITRDPSQALRYTNRSNLVAVITNGTAVLGLGNIGPLAGKPVMEGKAVLFKRFADVDVFDLELETTDPDRFIETVALLEPTFGGINLEDIRSPECFYIEKELKKRMSIPVFHDDQHGTAIITGAALLNAASLTGRNLEDMKVVINGAGAAGIACAEFYVELGVPRKNITLCDLDGVVYKGRKKDMNSFKEPFAKETAARSLEDALHGTDLFLGLSAAGALKKEYIRHMNPRPIIFALANPVPEIMPDEVRSVRDDAIIATGRSDFPNQVNNVLGFPFIFRGALDVAALEINCAMKRAAAHALAFIARLDVPDYIREIYKGEELFFGPDYIIPKPYDRRVFFQVSMAVARTAHETGVARIPYSGDMEYMQKLEERYNRSISRFE